MSLVIGHWSFVKTVFFITNLVFEQFMPVVYSEPASFYCCKR